MVEFSDRVEIDGRSTELPALVSLVFIVFFVGASLPFGVYAYQSGDQFIQAAAILTIPAALWGWIHFLRRSLRSLDLTVWSLPTTKGSIVAGLIALIALVALIMTKGAPGLVLAIEIAGALYVLALLILNYRCTHSMLLTIVLTVTHVCISALFVLFAIWLYARLQPSTGSHSA